MLTDPISLSVEDFLETIGLTLFTAVSEIPQFICYCSRKFHERQCIEFVAMIVY